MEEKGYENFYRGSNTPLDPGFGDFYIGHRIPQGELGAPTSPMTADQIREASKMLNTGMKIVEVGAIQPDVFEAIPKQHFKEMKRLAEITGTEMTMHGPIIDLAGFNGQGGWEEGQRKLAEAQLVDSLDKAHELNPKGNVPVTFHAGPPNPLQVLKHVPEKEAKEMIENIENRAKERAKKISEKTGQKIVDPYSPHDKKIIEDLKRGRMLDRLAVVNPETGQMQMMKYERQIWPEGVIEFDPRSRINAINQTEWDGGIYEVEKLEEEKHRFKQIMNIEEYGKIQEQLSNIDQNKRYSQEEIEEINNLISKKQQMERPLQEVNFHQYMKLKDMYNDYMKYGEDGKDKKTTSKNVKNIWEKYGNGQGYSNELIQSLKNEISRLPAPKKWKAADEFGTEKVAETTANAAFNAWKKYKEKTPIIALENYPDTIMSTGEDSKEVIEAARSKFVEKAVKSGVNEVEARKNANKLIGVTWDYGHLNMKRREGFDDKFMIEETKAIADYIKKEHLTDNFGFADSHLPPGMGNIPYKEALAILEKKGIKVPKIVEAAGMVQHFKTNPHPYVLEALGSPLYTYMESPYWNQTRQTYGMYSAGHGEFLPDFHFKTYGSTSFSNLPTDLGGDMPGDQRGNFAGNAME